MKATLLRCLGFGAGFALTLALLGGALFWYSSRPRSERPWNSVAFKASLSDIDAWQAEALIGSQPPNSGMLEFTYIVENRSGTDYSTTGASVVAMVQRPDGLVASEESIKVKYPIFIPSGQKVAVLLSIPYGDIGSVDKNTDLRKALREQLPKLSGFVLFDQATRYQIELPKGW